MRNCVHAGVVHSGLAQVICAGVRGVRKQDAGRSKQGPQRGAAGDAGAQLRRAQACGLGDDAESHRGNMVAPSAAAEPGQKMFGSAAGDHGRAARGSCVGDPVEQTGGLATPLGAAAAFLAVQCLEDEVEQTVFGANRDACIFQRSLIPPGMVRRSGRKCAHQSN